MRFEKSLIASIGYELPENVVTSDAIEDRLAPVYKTLGLQRGQLFALTGIRERRWWDPGQTMADGAARAARKAVERAGVDPADLGMLIYAGVCRDQLEPATACAVADAIGVSGEALVYDISNACLGVLNGMIQIAAAIELGQIRAGMVVSCESARQIVEMTIQRLLRNQDMQTLKSSLATMTGGSGAAAVILTDKSLAPRGHRLLGGVALAAPKHHRLCRWGPDTGIPSSGPMLMQTDAAAVLENGVALGVETFEAFRRELGWSAESGAPDKVVCHQVGAGHRFAVLEAIGIPPERDFSTFEHLGNIGTVSLPLTAAMAGERRFVNPGDRVGLFGIGSGLNCLLLGVEW